MSEIPRYRDLPVVQGAPPGAAWGVFGDEDNLGAMNLLTPERTLQAAALIRRGAVFPLNWGLDQPNPPILGRRPLKHTVHDGPSGPDDRYDDFYPQASSQWDALSHVRHPDHGYYNNLSAAGAGRDAKPIPLGIDAWAQKGLAGRFVLVDVASYFAARGTPIDGGASLEVTLDDVQAALDHQRLTVSPGTFLLLNFGWIDWYLGADETTRQRLARGADFGSVEDDLQNFFPAPGLARQEELAEWLWDSGVVAVAADCPAVESMPLHRDSAEGFLHYRLVPLLGIGIGEMWDLRALTADCAATGVYEGFLASAPLNMPGGTGSPANALAIK